MNRDDSPRQELLDAIEDALEPTAIVASTDVDEAMAAWSIGGTREAEWALRKRERARALLAELEQLAEEEIAALRFRVDQIGRPHRATIDYFDGRLEQYHREILREEPRRTTVELPGGKLTSTAGAVSIVVDNEAELVDWIESTVGTPEELLEYLQKPKKTELKKRFGVKIGDEAGDYPLADADGVVVPGARAVRGDRTFHVKPS